MVMLTVLPMNPDTIVLFMCSLAVVPAIWQAAESRLRWETASGKLDVFKFTTSFVSATIGIILLSLKIPDITGQFGTPVAVVILSIAWSPKFRKLQIQSKQQETRHCDDKVMTKSSVSGFSVHNNEPKQGVAQGPPVKIRTARGICETDAIPLPCNSQDQAYTLLAGALLWLSQFLATTYYVWKSQGRIMAKAHDLLWIPSYNGVCLEQYLLLNRRNQASDEEHATQQRTSRDINVFICTTMYHEEDYEMEQLLQSIHDVDINREKSGYHFESHVFFDGCVRADVLNNYVLQLASLVEKTLNVHLSECTKMKTPYGMQLKWRLPGGMDFTIHLKDNAKVKNKKRWSQVMYMSYVLDYKQRLLEVQDEQSFILTTDADVKFTYDSVEALIDQIVEDPRVGAVCARTHPLGSGPVVWYQIFDYAIGHWFQKVANHMLGSVLCSPGCFSLYRCQAVRDVLPTYATGVDHAFEFLTKDMGEDRWMCTLMVQRGWRLTYCAAAVDSTYCPESFDEFYKQRRRWTPSTLANLVLLVSEWRRILKNNEHISFPFIIYQTFLVCSTVIGPSTVILVIVGGMIFSGININEITTVVLISLVVVAYVIVCLFTPQNVQLKVSKLLTFVFAVIMCIVVIGVAVQISNEIKERKVEPTSAPTLQPNTTASTLATSLEHHLPAGVSTMYLAGLSGIFLAAALLHPNEFMCLLHGIWYILCLPSGYLLLTIYSLCNLTDRSWGTREGKATVSEEEDFYKQFVNFLSKICKCCQKQDKSETKQTKRGSLAEGRTNISVELGNSSSKTNGPSDPSTGTSLKVKMGTKEIIDLPHVEDSNKMVGESQDKQSPHIFPHDAPPGSARQATAGDDNDENQDHEMPRIVVYSAHDIPRKKRDGSSRKTKSKECMKCGEGTSHESTELAPILHNTLKPKEVDENKRFISSVENHCSESQNKVFQPVSRRRSTSPLSSNTRSKRDHSEVPREMPKKTSSDEHVSDRKLPEHNQQGFPPTVSAIITASTSILLDNPEEQSAGAEISYISRSLTSIRTTVENSRPDTALRNEVDLNSTVEDWLTEDFKHYAPNFREHGYDKASFLPGMTDKDLQTIGINERGHRQRLLRHIREIPRVDIEENIPENVENWLKQLGLGKYWPTFESSGYTEPNDLEDLKNMSKENLKETFNIHKPGHFNRLLSAIRKLQYPNQGQIKIRHTQRELDRLPLLYLDVDNSDEGNEYEFWEGLRQVCLIPELSAFGQTSKLKEKLVELRNTTLLVFGVSNALWMIIILTLVQHKDLKILGVDIIGLAFLTIYGCIFVVQFLALLGHRFKTIVHILARTPWIPKFNRVAPSESADE
ncbi:uncharacterized protein LOC144644771 isoform X1 [Oculina patagonica]